MNTNAALIFKAITDVMQPEPTEYKYSVNAVHFLDPITRDVSFNTWRCLSLYFYITYTSPMFLLCHHHFFFFICGICHNCRIPAKKIRLHGCQMLFGQTGKRSLISV